MSFFKIINDTILKIGRTPEMIIMGDFNSRVERKINIGVVGSYGKDNIN